VKNPSTQYLIIDLEATCWEHGTRPGRQEIIEIGAVHMLAPDQPAVDEFSAFVRPIKHPELSVFCKRLTSITQQDVDQAEPFPVVFRRFMDWVGPEPFLFCSWGDYDQNQLRVDCRRHGIPFPAPLENHLNLKRLFAEQRGLRPGGMREALRRLGLPLLGTHHRGIDDARNIARIAAQVLPAYNAHNP